MHVARLAALLLLLAAPLCGATGVRIGLMGDLPYTRWEREQLPGLVREMGEARIQLGIHVGDIKGGGAECRDEVYRDIRAEFDRARFPLLFVPGDNDWTDCHRWSNGGYDPLERLQFLREQFFTDTRTLGQSRLSLVRQPGYPENARLTLGPLVVVALNIPGSDNNYADAEGREPSPEFLARGEANRDWLTQAFAAAKERAALVIAIQANPRFDRDGKLPRNAGYQPFLDQLRREAGTFGKPVLLLHGDTHRVRIDRPLRDAEGRTMTNVMRVETFGSPRLGWVEIDFDAARSDPFQVTPHPWGEG